MKINEDVGSCKVFLKTKQERVAKRVEEINCEKAGFIKRYLMKTG